METVSAYARVVIHRTHMNMVLWGRLSVTILSGLGDPLASLNII